MSDILRLGKFFVLIFILSSHISFAQEADSTKNSPSNPGDLIISYEEAEQHLRNISNNLLTDFNTIDIREAYENKKGQLDTYLRIGEGHTETAGISRINDLLLIFERFQKELETWQSGLMNLTQKASEMKISINQEINRLSLNVDSLSPGGRSYYEARFAPTLTHADSVLADLDRTLQDVLYLEYRVSQDYVRVTDRIADLRDFRRNYWENITKKEDVTWQLSSQRLDESTQTVQHKFGDTLWRILDFFNVNKPITFLLVLIMVGAYLLLRHLRKVDQQRENGKGRYTGLYEQSIPMSLLLGGMLFPVLFPPTTTLMYDVVLLLSYLPFLFILYCHVGKNVFLRYVIFFVFFLVLKLQNLLLAGSGYSSILLISCAVIFIYCIHRGRIRSIFQVRWGWIKIFNWLLIFTLLFGILVVLLQRISLGRVFINGAGETIAISLVLVFVAHWTDLIIDFLKERPYFQKISMDPQRLDIFWQNWKNILYILILLLFLISTFRNFNIYSGIIDGLGTLLGDNRYLGEFTFTYAGILLFLFVLFISTRLSSTIKFLTEDKTFYKDQKTTASLSTMIRFFIIVGGFVLALLVSGIPMDRLTIILGALSVGIGFGLQNIVNNLISGMILVMERPIQTGDLIELQEYTGIVKEIGIRSSIIRTYDGAEVIVPNGHLISQEVINWTLSNKHRRVEVRVGVAYGSDAGKTLEILQKLMENHDKVLMLPHPAVYFDGFGDSSLNFRMLFWTGDIDNWLHLRSEMTARVYDTLNKSGIEIPFPQRDLHIRSWKGPMPQASESTHSSKKK